MLLLPVGMYLNSETLAYLISNTGQLPCLIHDHHIVVLLPSIIKYVSHLSERKNGGFADADLDRGLSSSQRSQGIAWSAHAEAHLGDLVVSVYMVPCAEI
jgi:sorting and assembly machinery component 37